MRLIWLAPVLLVAGCAHPVPARDVASVDLCRYMLRGGHDAAVAEIEARRRGFDCAPYMGALAAQDQARNRALMDAARYFNPPPQPMQRALSCNSYRMGNSVQTDCQ